MCLHSMKILMLFIQNSILDLQGIWAKKILHHHGNAVCILFAHTILGISICFLRESHEKSVNNDLSLLCKLSHDIVLLTVILARRCLSSDIILFRSESVNAHLAERIDYLSLSSCCYILSIMCMYRNGRFP